MNALNWIIDRLKERSTWLGLTALLTSFGVSLKPELAEAIITTGLGFAGLIGVLTKDKLPPRA